MSGNAKTLQKRFAKIRSRESQKSKIMAAVTAAVLAATALFATVAMAAFDADNTMSDWAKKDINKAKESLIIYDGMGITDYKQNITREMFCDMASQVFTKSDIQLTAWEYPFTDLKQDIGISSLYCMGIINGKTKTEFKPLDYITREEAAAVLHRMYLYTGMRIGVEDDFARFSDDGDMSDWARFSIYAMKSADIINGEENNRFNPKGNITIEQAISMFVRLCEVFENDAENVYESSTVRQDVRVFFSLFNQGDFENMKEMCTEECKNTFFGGGYCFGMKRAGLSNIEMIRRDDDTLIANVTVYMTPHETSIFGADQTTPSFYMIIKKQPDGKYLIDEFATGA